MAISGGCTASSYTYTWQGDTLTVTASGARLWSACATVTEAVAKLRRGEPATVAGVDHSRAPDAAQPAQMETSAPPVMLSPVDAAVQTLGGRKPILVAPDDVPAVLAQLAAVGN